MTLVINSSIPIEERKEYIKESLALTTSENPVENRQCVECANHEEMLKILKDIPLNCAISGVKDRYIVLPPIMK